MYSTTTIALKPTYPLDCIYIVLLKENTSSSSFPRLRVTRVYTFSLFANAYPCKLIIFEVSISFVTSINPWLNAIAGKTLQYTSAPNHFLFNFFSVLVYKPEYVIEPSDYFTHYTDE
jgi:hypothetical protein